MKRVLIFQHVGYEILGTLHPLVKAAGIRMRYINFGRHPETKLDVSNYDGLIILGGPMGVWEQDKHPHLTYEIECIREMIKNKKPILGICLGAQLIAAALGAEVKPAKEREIGWYTISLTKDGAKDPLLEALQSSDKIFQWHQDAFTLPSGAIWLAESKACRYQAFRYGENVYGFQFHLEVDQPMIERWLNLPDHQALLKSEGIDEIRRETFSRIDRSVELSRKVFSKYLDLFSTKKKTGVLKHS